MNVNFLIIAWRGFSGNDGKPSRSHGIHEFSMAPQVPVPVEEFPPGVDVAQAVGARLVDIAEASMAEVSIPLEDPLRVLLKPSPGLAGRVLGGATLYAYSATTSDKIHTKYKVHPSRHLPSALMSGLPGIPGAPCKHCAL